MPDENTDLPEGTDKVIVGASATTEGGDGANELNEETDVMLIEIDDRTPASGSGTPSGIGTTDGSTGTPSGGSDTAFAGDTSSDSGASGGSARKDAVINKLRTGSEKISGQAAEKARGFVGQGLERSAEALSNVSRLVGDTAQGIDERLGAEYGDYARRAATAIDDAAASLARKDADELIEDTRNFVRKSPGAALAGAAVIGFALARLVKAGLDRNAEDLENRRPDRPSDV